jgi:predicted DNA-binding protein YlxM (UPF0122 family)
MTDEILPAKTNERLPIGVAVYVDKLDDKQARFIEAYLDNNCSIGKACEIVGVSKSTVARWKDANDQFRTYFEAEFHDQLYRNVTGILLNAGQKGSVKAASRLLDHIERVKFNVDRRTGIAIQVNQNQQQAQSHDDKRQEATLEKQQTKRQVLWQAPDTINPDSLAVRDDNATI